MQKTPLPPELLALIQQARSLPNLSVQDRFVTPATVADTLHERAKSQPNAPFLTFLDDAGGVRSYTYAEFYQRVRRIAATLLVLEGFHAGGRIATAMHNHDEAIFINFAAWHIGATVVPLNMGEEDKRLSYVLEHSGATVMFVLKEYAHRLRRLWQNLETVHHIVLVPDKPEPSPSSASSSFHGMKGDGASGEVNLYDILPTVDIPMVAHTRTISPDHEALIVYTSGTTGVPKGVVLSQYNLISDACAIAQWHGFDPGTRLMCVLPVHHVNGLIATHVTPMFCGGSVVLARKFSAQTFFKTVARYNVQIVSVVPTLLQFLLEATPKEFDNRKEAPSLQYVICGAGPLTVDLAARFEDRFSIPICHGYGLSETTCYSCFVPVVKALPQGAATPASWTAHKSWLRDFGYPSIGIPIGTNLMAIHDEKGQPQAEGVKGEIVIRGHNVMLGYHDNLEANEKAFTHGWFRSGDEGFFKVSPTGEMYFFISGRFKELIIRGGVKISPLEVDEVLNRITGVKSAMAVGFDNVAYGEEVGAYVVKLPGSDLTAASVINACREKLPFWMSPKAVVFGESFPVTSTGKYQRNQLKPLFEEHNGTQFREK